MAPRRERCCWCIPFRIATLLGGLILAVLGGAGSYAYFTNSDLPTRTITAGGISIAPLASGVTLWYYFAAVSVLAAAVGLFGMIAALAASRRAVKAFEAFYVLALLTQFAFIIWALIWCKQNQTEFDTICNASKQGQVNLPIPGFASAWDCQKIFTAGIITIGVGGVFWLGFNFFMTNRVIHYARELFADKANRYKVLGEAATKELDREQQIPLNYTNVGSSMNDQEGFNNAHLHQQPSYRDEIEYKDPRGGDDGYMEHSRAAAAGFGAYGQDLSMQPQQFQQHQQQHHFNQPQHYQPHPVAPGFSHRDSAQGLDLVNPYYGEQEVIPQPPMALETTPVPISHTSTAAFAAIPATPVVAAMTPGAGQTFVHGMTNKISSPFDDDEPMTTETTTTTAAAAHGMYSPGMDGIKVPLPASPKETDIASPTVPFSPVGILSPRSPIHKVPVESSESGSGSGSGKGLGEPYQF